jgi:monoamine oxidase
MSVKTRFWLEDHLTPNGSSDRIGLLWEGTDNQNLPPDAPATLMLFLGGDPAARASTRSDPNAYCDSELAALYPKLAPNVIRRDFINWPAEPYIRGGYSCPRLGEVCSIIAPMHDSTGPIVFAGEHTTMPFFGYMEGALQSGIRAAHKVAAQAGIGAAIQLAATRREHALKRAAASL